MIFRLWGGVVGFLALSFLIALRKTNPSSLLILWVGKIPTCLNVVRVMFNARWGLAKSLDAMLDGGSCV
jgi:hypothetical protein